MAGILGEGIASYVANQINDRQQYVGQITRSANTLSYFHSRTAWVKLGSSSLVAANPGLARSYILFAGKNLNSGIRPGGAYDTSDPDFGIVPTPGILSLDVKALNRGSIKEAHVKFKASSRKQFEDIDKVYLRLGFNMLVEWGWSNYVVGGATYTLGTTLIDDEWWTKSDVDYVYWLKRIKQTREKYHGNYDGFFGRVTNYNWKFNPDGSYDIDLKLISHGDVVESLRTVPPGGKLAGANSVEVDKYYSSTPVSSVFLEGGIKASTGIVGIINSEDSPDLSPNKKYLLDVSPIKDKLSEHLFAIQFYGWAMNNDQTYTSDQGDSDSITYFKLKPDDTTNKKEDIFINTDGKDYGPVGLSFLANKTLGDKKDAFFLYYKPSKPDAEDTELPNISPTEAQVYVRFGYLLWYLNQYCLPVNKTTKNPPFIIDYRGPGSVKGDKPIPMYLPEQQKLTLSYNPSKYIVRNPKHNFSTLKATCSAPNSDMYKGLENAIDESISGMPFIDARHIYCNVSNILSKISLSPNDQNEIKIDIFGLLKDICNEINISLGSINNLEPVMDEDTNTLIITDSTNFPKKAELLEKLGLEKPRKDYLLQMFGYRSFNGLVASFVRDINLETKLSKETATLITIGATAKGSYPGTDATAFSRINEGTKDRFTEEYIDPSGTTSSPPTPIYDQLAEAVKINYYSLYGYNLDANQFPPELAATDTKPKFFPFADQSAQEKNVQLIKDYLAFHESELHENTEAGGPGVGFLPFELSLDMDGLSGIKIYNGLVLDTSFLPKNYPKSLEFVLAGVDHVVQNNDWITKLRVIACPKTDGVILPQSSPPGTFAGGSTTSTPVIVSTPSTNPPGGSSPSSADCVSFFNSIPPARWSYYDNGEDKRSLVKAAKKTQLEYFNVPNTIPDIIAFLINRNEGGYFHPLHHRDNNHVLCTTNACNSLAVSGETLWGEDRVAGYAGNRAGYPLKAQFWDLVDKWSGFGDLSQYNDKHNRVSAFWGTGNSSVPKGKFLMYRGRGMEHGDWAVPKTYGPRNNYPAYTGATLEAFKKDLDKMLLIKGKIVEEETFSQLDSNFKGKYAEIKTLIKSDVNLLYLWVRARYNGPTWFNAYAANFKKVWDSGERDVKKLICEDLKYRWSYNFGKTYQPDIQRTIDFYRYAYV